MNIDTHTRDTYIHIDAVVIGYMFIFIYKYILFENEEKNTKQKLLNALGQKTMDISTKIASTMKTTTPTTTMIQEQH